MLTGQGLLVILAGYFETTTGLPPLEIQVDSSIEQKTTAELQPGFAVDSLDDKEQRIVANSTQLIISTEQISRAYADSILGQIRAWNIEHGFYIDETKKEEDDKQPSWWSRNVSQKLESFLRKNFGTDEAIDLSDASGNIGLASFHLQHPPDEGEEIIVNFSRERGDKSISLVEGFRFTFNKENWNIPAYSAIQLDPKLQTVSTARFIGRSGNIPLAWSLTFVILAGLFVCFFIYHKFILPYPKADSLRSDELKKENTFWKEFVETFVLFFKRKEIGSIIAFLLLYRLAESQIVKLASPFLLDAQEVGGLGLTTGSVGLIYGTVGMIALLSGGILGGYLAARNGLKYWIWWMIVAMNLPNLVYVYLSQVQPDSMIYIYLAVGIEQFGYGFGFTAYMLYMILVSDGKHKTAHFAITTGFMALGMMIPGMISGWIQEIIGYPNFFLWVMICTIPSFIVLLFVKIDPEFGLKKEKE
jgi:PAT family beta-lactamase induction signal transducer AmpG